MWATSVVQYEPVYRYLGKRTFWAHCAVQHRRLCPSLHRVCFSKKDNKRTSTPQFRGVVTPVMRDDQKKQRDRFGYTLGRTLHAQPIAKNALPTPAFQKETRPARFVGLATDHIERVAHHQPCRFLRRFAQNAGWRRRHHHHARASRHPGRCLHQGHVWRGGQLAADPHPHGLAARWARHELWHRRQGRPDRSVQL